MPVEGDFKQDENIPLDLFSQLDSFPQFDSFSQLGEDQTNTDLFASGCPATNRLGARDGELVCPPDEPKVPELPTFDMLNNLVSPGSTAEKQDRSEDIPLTDTGKDGSCPPLRPFHMCCICEGYFQFTYCQDCLPSKPCSYLFITACRYRAVS